MDNAIDAMSGEGAIEESTQRTADHVAGELTDYGPVASAEAAVHICDQD